MFRGGVCPEKFRKFITDERGEIASSVIAFPVFIASFMLAIQVGLTFHARSLVQTAAQEAAQAAQIENATASDGNAAANNWISDGGLLKNPNVKVSRTEDTVTVEIESDVTSLVPFWEPSVAGSASGPIEKFRSEADL